MIGTSVMKELNASWSAALMTHDHCVLARTLN